MKNIFDILRQKELEYTQLQKDLSALYLVVPMVAEASDPKIDPKNVEVQLP